MQFQYHFSYTILITKREIKKKNFYSGSEREKGAEYFSVPLFMFGVLPITRWRIPPSIVLARSDEPIMEPKEEYEKVGFFGDVVFTNGHLVDGDNLTIYYGASDEVICGAEFSISRILESLG